MTYPQRAIHVGGLFTIGLIVINVLFSGLTPVSAALVSLVMGMAFTGAALWTGNEAPTRRRY